MIYVKAWLVRGPVFLAGETVECVVSFYNSDKPRDVVGEGGDPLGAAPVAEGDRHQNVAWCTAQINCICSCNRARVKLARLKHNEGHIRTNSDTSFIPTKGEKGQSILSTEPTILFCDLNLEPGQTKTFTYRDTLAFDAPPSYSGQAVRYSYKIVIGSQRPNNPIRLLKVPFRVMVLYGLYESLQDSDDDTESLNPFLSTAESDKLSLCQRAERIISTITVRRSSNTYNITNNRGRVARLTVLKSAYRLGEDVVGVFDFADCSEKCLQYSVSLQSEEHISEEYKTRASQHAMTTIVSSTDDFSVNLLSSCFTLPIPLTATPAFMSDMVCLKWHLHFQFVILADSDELAAASSVESWRAPTDVNVETMLWDLPVKIVPVSPAQVNVTASNSRTGTPSIAL